MIGVVVSHSRALGRAAVALASEMVPGSGIRIEIAAGLDEQTFGTDAVAVAEAIGAADTGDGVLVLMDLGSAVLSAELALELLETPHEVRLCAAPIVEGLVAAAVAAAGGADLAEAAAEAEHSLLAKSTQLSPASPDRGDENTSETALPAAGVREVPSEVREPAAVRAGEVVAQRERAVGGAEVRGVFVVTNPHGLHARPAARLVAEVRTLDAIVDLRNLTTGAGPVPGRSLSRVAALGALSGHWIEVVATGPEAEAAVYRLRELAERRFDEGADVAVSGMGEPIAAATATSHSSRPAGASPAISHGSPPAGAVATVSAGGMGDRSEGGRAVLAVPGSTGEQVAESISADRSAGSAGGGFDRVSRGPLPASGGIAIGPVWHAGVGEFVLPAKPEGSPEAEWERLVVAIAAVRRRIEAIVAQTGPAEAAIFRAHLLLLDDDELVGVARQRIGAGAHAASAWSIESSRAAADLARLPDDYQRARAADLVAVRDQVLGELLGSSTEIVSRPGILVAVELTPAQVAALDRSLVTGMVLTQGSPTAHSAILARSRGIPAVVAAGSDLLTVPEGTTVAFDGGNGQLVVDPGPAMLAEFAARAAGQRARQRAAEAAANRPAVTIDGVTVEVAGNVGSLVDAVEAVAHGADSAGLVRTEFLFLDRDHAPTVAEQEQVYREIAKAFDGRRIVLRTLDAGGDKPLPYLARPPEANPFLGVRGIRLAAGHADLLRDQLQAMAAVAADHPVRVMFPMVSTVDEVRAARAIVKEVAPQDLRIEVGIMVEVPATAAKAAAFAGHVDFFCIGTNDLTQYALAAERGNDALAALADPLDPGVLRLIDLVCRGAGGLPVAVCGEIASDPVAVPVLLGLGVTELSVAVPMIALVKAVIRELDLAHCRALSIAALGAESAAAVRAMVTGGS
ncbi:phosphoenolpyruvate--protein phosphotransferase [Nocardia sp. BMG111209]|uniref:phosphoenolpyruvate--protein phosphotransferase n=1 Tax=Nocardia sp. BMG111209 TaxID=1160137 RepID=UPI0003A3FB69|nr:phosphoenolpyruvate--protein phosphotransferase [Nocardia sp. BMG111209]